MKEKVLRNLIGIVLLVILVFTAIGCSGNTAASSTTTTSTAATTTAVTTSKTTTSTTAVTSSTTTTASGNVAYTDAGVAYTPYTGKFDRTFTFYCIEPMSGNASVYGINDTLGTKHAVNDMNAMGGLLIDGIRYKLAYQTLDSKYDSATAAQIAQQVVLQNNGRFVHIVGTAPTLGCEDFLAQSNVFVMTSALSSPLCVGTKWPLQFAYNPQPVDYGPSTFYPWVVSNLGVKTVAMANPDSDNGRVFSNAVKNAVKLYNIPVTLLTDEFYTPGTQDFSPLINKLIALNPDMIDLAGSSPGDTALCVKQIREKGYKGITANLVTQGDPATMWSVAGANATGHYTIGISGDPTPAFSNFRKIIEKETGQPLYVSPPYSYEQNLVSFMAMNQTNSFDPYKIAAVQQDMKWNILYGPCSYIGGTPGSIFALKRVNCVTESLLQVTTNGQAKIVVTIPYPGT
ncbi:MAG TPA: ABC transporter substrate-binding protein [Dehalococcoidales bacterium]|nr:ABC transporter substrate-binding protein [Dehalococcoidales bacterium]